MPGKRFKKIIAVIKAMDVTACSITHGFNIFSEGKGEVEVNPITPTTVKFIETATWNFIYDKKVKIFYYGNLIRMNL